MYLSGIPFWVDATTTLVRHASGNANEMYLSSTSSQQQVVQEARLYLMISGLLGVVGFINSGLANMLTRYWILPSLLGQPILRAYLLAEHRGKHAGKDTLVYESTRTMVNNNPLLVKLAWNMPYHVEHHAWPAVPFWRLKEVHRLLSASPNIGALPTDWKYSGGYLRFNWKCFVDLFQKARQ